MYEALEDPSGHQRVRQGPVFDLEVELHRLDELLERQRSIASSVVRSGESIRVWVHCAPVAALVLKPTEPTANVAQPPTSSGTQPFTPSR